MVEVTNFALPEINNAFTAVRVGIKGLQSTTEDMQKITNMSNVSAKINSETSENEFYGDAGKSTIKKSKSPSVEVTFVYSGTEVHNYLLQAGWEVGEAAITQVECDTIDGYVVSFLANVELDNFGADGAPSDNAEYTVTLSYAGGASSKVKKEEVVG